MVEVILSIWILIGLPGVLSVRPDLDINSTSKDYGCSVLQFNATSSIYPGSSFLFPPGKSKRWIVRVEKPSTVLITKAQIVDYYAQFLTKVLGKYVLDFGVSVSLSFFLLHVYCHCISDMRCDPSQ